MFCGVWVRKLQSMQAPVKHYYSYSFFYLKFTLNLVHSRALAAVIKEISQGLLLDWYNGALWSLSSKIRDWFSNNLVDGRGPVFLGLRELNTSVKQGMELRLKLLGFGLVILRSASVFLGLCPMVLKLEGDIDQLTDYWGNMMKEMLS